MLYIIYVNCLFKWYVSLYIALISPIDSASKALFMLPICYHACCCDNKTGNVITISLFFSITDLSREIVRIELKPITQVLNM